MPTPTYRFPFAYPLTTQKALLPNKNRSEAGGVWYKDCVYYWWFEFLRLSEGYRRTCYARTNKNKKKLAVYNDFGDVFNTTFQKWWKQRGNDLFGVERNMSVFQTNTAINDENNITITIPLTLPKRTLTKELKKIVNQHHKAKWGRVKASDRLVAKYTPTNDRVSALKKLHLFLRMKQKYELDSNKFVWIECERLDKTFKIKHDDSKQTRGRNKEENIRSYASRYAVKCKQILDNIVKGVF